MDGFSVTNYFALVTHPPGYMLLVEEIDLTWSFELDHHIR